MDCSQVFSARSLLKRPGLWMGSGPLIKMDLPVAANRLKRSSKSNFVSSDCRRDVSLEPAWITIRVMEDGSESNNSGSLLIIAGTVAPGKQRVDALKKRISLVMESPTISVVGEKRGRGGGSCGDSLLDGAGGQETPCVSAGDGRGDLGDGLPGCD